MPPQPSRTAPSPIVSGLNPAQREAVTTTEGPLLVLAGAGTGKTRVITHRVAHLLQRGIPPQSILGVTFTNKAAREMRERVDHILGRKPEGLTLSTFHSLGARILRVEAGHLGYRKNFNIHDTADQIGLLRMILREVRGEGSTADPKAALASISRAKNRFQLPEDLEAVAADDEDAWIAAVYRRYQTALRDMNCVDFDDLILLPARLLAAHEDVGRKYRQLFRYLLVDEYQDTNGAQYRFLRALVGPERNLCVVGDDDQSIYGFRGAEVDKILAFERDFPGAKVVKLEENYRSTKAILNLANAVIEGAVSRHGKVLRSTIEGDEPVRCVETGDEVEEVDFVLGEIQALRQRRVPWSEIAILIRAASQARPFEEKLRLRRIPYVLVGGQSYFDRKEVRDILAYWMVVANPSDDTSLLRILNVPKRGFGSAAIRKLDEMSRASRRPILESLRAARGSEGEFASSIRTAAGHVVDLFDRARERLAARRICEMARGVIAESDYVSAVHELYPDPLVRQARWALVEELCRTVERWETEAPGGDFAEFVASLRLEQVEPRSEKPVDRSRLALMTLHGAKGLEFDHVFLVGVEEDLLPHRRSLAEGDASLDEERRLLYVGITRARRGLTLVRARTRTAHGRSRPREPSRFLREVAGRGLFEAARHNPHTQPSAEQVEGYLEAYRRLRGQS